MSREFLLARSRMVAHRLRRQVLIVVAIFGLLAVALAFHALSHAIASDTRHVFALAPRHMIGSFALAAIASLLRLIAALVLSVPVAFLMAKFSQNRSVVGACLCSLEDYTAGFPFILLFMLLRPVSIELAFLLPTCLCLAWPAARTARDALANIPLAFSETTSALAMTRWQTLWRLDAPSCVPAIATTLRGSLSFAWLTLMGAEMLDANSIASHGRTGVGHLIAAAYQNGDWLWVLAALVLLAALILFVDLGLVRPWQGWATRFDVNPRRERALDTWLHAHWQRANWLRFMRLRLRRWGLWMGNLRLGRSILSRYDEELVAEESKQSNVGWSFYLALGIVTCAIYWIDRRNTAGLFLAFQMLSISISRLIIACALVGLMSVVCLAVCGGHKRGLAAALFLTRLVRFFPLITLFPGLVALFAAYGVPRSIWAILVMVFALFWTVLLALLSRLSSIPKDLQRASRYLNLRGVTLWRRVRLPVLRPALASGSALAMQYGWNILIFSEFAVADHRSFQSNGIGGFVASAILRNNWEEFAVGALLILSVSVVLQYVSARISDHIGMTPSITFINEANLSP